VSAGTLQRYQAVRDHHVAFCARRGIETWNAFDKTTLERYAQAREPSCAYRTLYFELTVLKGVVKWLVAACHLPAAATLHYALRKPQGSDTYCYSQAEVAAILTHCHAALRLHWLGDVILALAHTGMRIGELAGLRWRDVDLGANTLHIADERTSRRLMAAGTARTTKGRRSRRIPIHSQLRRLLVRLPRTADGRVFRAERGGVLRPRNVLTIFIRDVIEPLKARFPTPPGEIGFADGRLHSLRHFFCSQAFLGGASEGEIRDWLGHADSKLVELYRHLRNDDAQRKMEAIEFVEEARPGIAREVSY
jgi:integrase